MPPPLPLVQGTLDLLVLRTLAPAPMHGYGIATRVHERTSAALAIEDAALYQALHRLEHKKWEAPYWGVSENNRKAKFYELTTEGRQQLRAESSTWKSYAQAVSLVLEPS